MLGLHSRLSFTREKLCLKQGALTKEQGGGLSDLDIGYADMCGRL